MKRLLSTAILLLGLSPPVMAQAENAQPTAPNANPMMNTPDDRLPAPCGTNSSVADLDEPDHQGPVQPVATPKSGNRMADTECANNKDSAAKNNATHNKTPTEAKPPANK